MKTLSDGSYLVAGKNPQVDKVTIVAKTDLAKEITGFRVEALAHDSLGGHGPGRTEHGNFVLSEFRAFAAPTAEIKTDHRVALDRAVADFAQDGFPAADAMDGKEPTGWAIVPQTGRDHWIVFTAKQPIKSSERPWLQLVLSQNHGQQHTLGRFRVMAVTGHDPLLGIPQAIRDVLAVPSDKRSAEQATALVEYRAAENKETAELIDEVNKLATRVLAEPVMKARVIAERTAKRRASHVLAPGRFLAARD